MGGKVLARARCRASRETGCGWVTRSLGTLAPYSGPLPYSPCSTRSHGVHQAIFTAMCASTCTSVVRGPRRRSGLGPHRWSSTPHRPGAWLIEFRRPRPVYHLARPATAPGASGWTHSWRACLCGGQRGGLSCLWRADRCGDHAAAQRPPQAFVPVLRDDEPPWREKGKEGSIRARDPVCGMQVDEQTAQKSEHEVQTYYFCSSDCQQQFERNPQRYTNK